MDALGMLAAFAPGDLARLQYNTFIAQSTAPSYTIPSSKFIIVFSFSGSEQPVLVAKGTTTGYAILPIPGSNNVAIGFSGTKITLTCTNYREISVAYCPV